ncbi:hypothetical protein Tco_1176222 [Tanacetum coccineum]
MPPRAMTQVAIEKLVSDRVAAALAQDRATRGNTNGVGGSSGNTGGNAGGQGRAPPARECTYSSFMKCNPTSFHGNEGVVELCHSNISAYTQRFNELVLLCPEMVPSKRKKVDAYLCGLPENIKGEKTSSRPVVLNEVVRMAHTLMEQKLQAKSERIAESNKRKWENNNNNNNQRNYRNNNRHNQNNNQRHGNARALTTTQNAGSNQTRVVSKCNRCGVCHFD